MRSRQSCRRARWWWKACRHVVRDADTTASLTRRPVLFALVCAPGVRHGLATRPGKCCSPEHFAQNTPTSRHRARLRVEIGRLRTALRGLARVTATSGESPGATHGARRCRAHAPGRVAVCGRARRARDGEAWSSSSLALALDASQRSVQTGVLEALAAEGRAQPVGSGRARRWMMPPGAGFTTPSSSPVPPVRG